MGISSLAYLKLEKPSETKPATEMWTVQRAGQEFEVLRRGGTIKVRLDRPRRCNSLSSSMMKEVTELFKSLSVDDSVHRIILTGRGQYFCAGMDLNEDICALSNERYMVLQRLFSAIETSPKTTIAVINGPAFGGGIGLAFACDLRIATSNSFFCLSEVKLGLCPATIARILVREWGPAIARMAMVTGRKIGPQLLCNIGVIHAVAPELESLEDELEKLLGELNGAAPQASAWCKLLVRKAHEMGDGAKSLSRDIFEAMLAEDSEASHGVEQFLAGAKHICWEELVWPKIAK